MPICFKEHRLLDSSQPQTRLLDKQNVLKKLSEIIVWIHERREFVSCDRVKNELFNHFGVSSWGQLNIHQNELNPWMVLIDRLKKVTFFMQNFERVYVLCTLHDLGPLLAKFLEIPTYEHAHLGPLEKHPDVKRVFDYESTKPNQPIPTMTSGEVISFFINFEEHSRRNIEFGEFLDALVYHYQLKTRKELGLYCKSFPFLKQVCML